MVHVESLPFSFCSTGDRKSTRLNSSHLVISYAVFCLKKKIDFRAARDVSLRVPARNRTSATPPLPTGGRAAFFFFLRKRRPPSSTLFPYTPLFRSADKLGEDLRDRSLAVKGAAPAA